MNNINISRLFKLCQEYDSIKGDYPKSQREGDAVYGFIMMKLFSNDSWNFLRQVEGISEKRIKNIRMEFDLPQQAYSIEYLERNLFKIKNIGRTMSLRIIEAIKEIRQ